MNTKTNLQANGTAATFDKKSNSLVEALAAARLIAENCFAEAAENDTDGSFPVETFRQIAAAGLLAAPLPQNLGGIGLGLENSTTFELLQLLKTLGRGNLVVGRVYEGHFNALLLLKLFATPQQFKKFAAEVCEENKIFGVWNTEAADGVKIHPTGNGNFRLAGAKTFATGVDFVERPFVNGVLPDGGWQMCIVPMEKVLTEIDESWWQPLGMKATRSFRVDFTGVEITAENLIGAAGDYYRQPWFSGGAIRFAAVQLGAAEALFDETRQYLRNLNRTGDTFQQIRLSEMAISLESGNLWLESAAQKFDEWAGDSSESATAKLLAYTAMMRTAIEQICQDTMLLCARSIGARGLLRPLPFERIIRDLTIYLRQPAPDATITGIGSYVLNNNKINEDLWKNES